MASTIFKKCCSCGHHMVKCMSNNRYHDQPVWIAAHCSNTDCHEKPIKIMLGPQWEGEITAAFRLMESAPHSKQCQCFACEYFRTPEGQDRHRRLVNGNLAYGEQNTWPPAPSLGTQSAIPQAGEPLPAGESTGKCDPCQQTPEAGRKACEADQTTDPLAPTAHQSHHEPEKESEDSHNAHHPDTPTETADEHSHAQTPPTGPLAESGKDGSPDTQPASQSEQESSEDHINTIELHDALDHYGLQWKPGSGRWDYHRTLTMKHLSGEHPFSADNPHHNKIKRAIEERFVRGYCSAWPDSHQNSRQQANYLIQDEWNKEAEMLLEEAQVNPQILIDVIQTVTTINRIAFGDKGRTIWCWLFERMIGKGTNTLILPHHIKLRCPLSMSDDWKCTSVSAIKQTPSEMPYGPLIPVKGERYKIGDSAQNPRWHMRVHEINPPAKKTTHFMTRYQTVVNI